MLLCSFKETVPPSADDPLVVQKESSKSGRIRISADPCSRMTGYLELCPVLDDDPDGRNLIIHPFLQTYKTKKRDERILEHLRILVKCMERTTLL